MTDAILPPLQIIPSEIQSLADYERLAPRHIPAATWQHIASGAGAGRSLIDNRAQFDRYHLIPRMLRDMRGASTAITLFGGRHAAPLLLAPVAYHKLVHPEGELASIRAATAMASSMIVSTLASYRMEEIAQTARQASAALGQAALPPLWFQLYFQADPADTARLVRRAEAAGYGVLVVTVDAPVKRSGFALPADVEAANLRDMPRISQNSMPQQGHILLGSALLNAAPTWDDIRWLRSITSLPLVIKGLLAPEDARMARALGANGMIISNHGGRVLDGLASPLDLLPAMVDAVGPDVPILLDSGVRAGTDVIKALALGAKAVLIGRPQLHALAVGGMAGSAHMLHLLRAEIELAMAHIGCATLSDIQPCHIRRVS